MIDKAELLSKGASFSFSRALSNTKVEFEPFKTAAKQEIEHYVTRQIGIDVISQLIGMPELKIKVEAGWFPASPSQKLPGISGEVYRCNVTVLPMHLNFPKEKIKTIMKKREIQGNIGPFLVTNEEWECPYCKIFINSCTWIMDLHDKYAICPNCNQRSISEVMQ